MAFMHLLRPLRAATLSVSAIVTLALAAPPVLAQSTAELAAQRDAVFARMIDAPADRALMSEYARLSVAMRDYESAIATLERLLDLEPGNATARLELATAYFAIGNNALAEYHLAAATASGALGPEQLSTAEAYRTAAVARDEPAMLSGSVAAGIVAADGETGFIGNGNLTFSLDLGDANATRWITQAGFSTYQIDPGPGASTSDRRLFRLRSGPQFLLTGEAFGPRLQPYVQLESARYPDAPASDYDAIFFGVAYQNAHSAEWSSFADIALGRGELRQSGADIDFHELDAGVVYRPGSDAFVRLTFSLDGEDTATRHEDRRAVRIDYSRDFDVPSVRTLRNWQAGAFASVDWYDITDMGTPADRTVHAAGLSLRAYFTDDFFVETRGTHVSRNGVTDSNETILSMQLGLEF